MNWTKLAISAAAGATLLGAAPAFASPPQWAPAYGWHAKHHHRPRPLVVYAPAPVYYVPAPVYYAPPPRVVVPGAVIYGNVPVGHNLNIGFGLRL